MIRTLAGAVIVGADHPLAGRAPFAHASAALRWGEENGVALARRYLDGERVEADPRDGGDWQRLVDLREVTSFSTPVTALSGGHVWILRPTFDDASRESLEI
ncbi:MAG: hypothetical protein QME96_16830, partial [Myxococcota bacterium]|nr:hypothetical protein [Myxococcota bacterium]